MYIVGGTMGAGKTAVCRELEKMLPDCVFLDGDWCWDANPFHVNEETKSMVIRNICFLLNQFLHCSVYENVVFCWVLHEQSIIDAILSELDTVNCRKIIISLVCGPDTLRRRLEKDISGGLRTKDVLERSIARLGMYNQLESLKIETDGKNVREIAAEIASL